jgi:nucleoid-associated protein
MPIIHAITHHIRRTAESGSELSLRPEELSTEGYSETLLGKLKSSFLARISREHGSFSAEGEKALLPRELEAFLCADRTFTQLSSALMEALGKMAEEKKFELDAHALFFVEKSFDHHVFYLFLTRLSESLTISDTLDITPAYAIDTGPALFGIKVDLAEWKEHQNYAYLSLLPPRGNPSLAESFYALTGFHNGIDKEKATLAFLEGVEAFAKHVPEERVNDYRSQVVGYCMEQEEKDAPVQLEGLAKSVEGINPEEFVRIVASHAPEGEQELMVDRRSLRRYVKFAGREKDLAISFNSYQLDKRVQYDADTDTLSINGLPKALRDQLLRHRNAE